MGVARGVAERELREAGKSLIILSLEGADTPRPGPLLGGAACLGCPGPLLLRGLRLFPACPSVR